MTTPTELLDAMIEVLTDAPLNLVASTASYLPAITTTQVALIGVSTGHETEAISSTMTEVLYIHRLRLQLWVKLTQGQEAIAHVTARDIGYRAMGVLIANDKSGGYEIAVDPGRGALMTYAVDQQVNSEGGQGYLIGTLTVPVWHVEEMS